VVDSDSGKVLADVKQQTETDFIPSGGDSQPKTVSQTHIDIPSAGVHKTFVGGDRKSSEENTNGAAEAEDNADAAADVVAAAGAEGGDEGEDEEEPDLTPADMAAYLYETQQFGAFYAAMDRLVNQSKMSPEDAEAYARTVAVEYERLQLQDLEDRYMIERRSFHQSVPQNNFYGSAPGYDVYSPPMAVPESSDPSFDMLAYINSLMSPEEQFLAQRQAQNEADLTSSDTIDPYQFVAALWNEAYEHGNEEAQEIVRLLYDRVSQDSNPDDMGEIRDILLDTVAQSLGEDTPFVFDTPIDTPLNMPQMPVNQEEAELETSEGVANDAAQSEANEADKVPEKDEEKEKKEVEDETAGKEEKSAEDKEQVPKVEGKTGEQGEKKH
ncbi:hypothetical protein EGW08_005579, partial [Elysia chlorotica]